MRFLVDECAGPWLARQLAEWGHDVSSVYDDSRGLADRQVLRLAHGTDRILVTCDRHFGERIYRRGEPHKGVVLLRLADERIGSKVEAMRRLLATCPQRLPGAFVVVSERAIRVAKGGRT